MRILICGGGISGLSTALALKGDGHEIELVEKAPAWRAEGAGLHLPGNAARAMEQLGIFAQVAAQAFTIPRIRYLDNRAGRLFDLELHDGFWPVFLRNGLMKRLGPKVLASGWRPLIDQAF